MREVVIAIAMGAAWVFLYMVIGGRWPKPFRSGPLTSGMQWRAAIATLLFIALFAAGAIAGLWTLPPQTQVTTRAYPHTCDVRDIGILTADSVARQINRESFLLLGGTAALLMQVAHPLVAAGVDQHSDFRRSPVRRLVRTVNTTLAIVFGERATAESALKRIGRSHAPVRGQAVDGRAYRARDPELMLWVQATLVLTSVRWYEAIMGGLTDAERDAYWSEGKFFAGKLGVPEALFPATYADLERYEEKMLRTAVVPDPTATSVAHDVVRPYAWLPEIAYWPTDALSAALLPVPLRDAFGLRFELPQRIFYRAVIVAIRGLRPHLPEWLTVVPQARRFEKALIGHRVAA